MLHIDNSGGRLSAWGVAANIKYIMWRQPPDNLPVRGYGLDLKGAKIYGTFDDGTERDITDYCTFFPSQGTPIWEDDAIVVTAYYTAKAGKKLSTDLRLPICVPEVRVVVDADYQPRENYYNVDSPLFDPDTMPLDKSKWRFYCLWKRENEEGEEVVVKVTPIYDDDLYYYWTYGVMYLYGGQYADYREVRGISAERHTFTDVENYHSIFTPTIESFERPVLVHAQATVGNDMTKTSNFGYFEALPIKLTYVDLPTEFVDEVPTHFTKDNIRFSWGDSELETPIAGLNDMWLGVNLGVPVRGSSVTDELDYTFENGDVGDFCPARRGPGAWIEGEPLYRYTRYHYVCANNKIEWTLIEE